MTRFVAEGLVELSDGRVVSLAGPVTSKDMGEVLAFMTGRMSKRPRPYTPSPPRPAKSQELFPGRELPLKHMPHLGQSSNEETPEEIARRRRVPRPQMVMVGFPGGGGGAGPAGMAGSQGPAGPAGSPGASGFSGFSGAGGGGGGASGFSGISGYSGVSGTSGYSGVSGTSGYSGVSGYSGATGGGGGADVAAYVERQFTPQSIPNATQTLISFDNEELDTDGFIAVPSDTLTIPAGKDGSYVIHAQVFFDASAVGVRMGVVEINGGIRLRLFMNAVTSGEVTDFTISGEVILIQDDTIKLSVLQTSLGALDCRARLQLRKVDKAG